MVRSLERELAWRQPRQKATDDRVSYLRPSLMESVVKGEIEALRPSKYANHKYLAGRDEVPDVAPNARATLELLYRAIDTYGPMDYLMLGHLARDHDHTGSDQEHHIGTLLGGLIYVRQAIRSGYLLEADQPRESGRPAAPAGTAGEEAGLTGILEVIDEIDELLGDADVEDDPAR